MKFKLGLNLLVWALHKVAFESELALANAKLGHFDESARLLLRAK